ncbi:MAG: phosphoribosylglycinamide formyltransferase [Flavobacteriaceae bacterium]
MDQKKIVVFASGSGSNFSNICEYFSRKTEISVELLVCNNPKAKAINIAKLWGVKAINIDTEAFHGNELLSKLKKVNPRLIVLAGFLWKIPNTIIKSFSKKIINIHPSLLPKFGGKGMYGINVHRSVIKNKEHSSGLTIHYVDEKYDNGGIIFQKKTDITENDTAETLAKKILLLEHQYYPKIIESLLKKENETY